jgi:AcrR family transcriptional regulator
MDPMESPANADSENDEDREDDGGSEPAISRNPAATASRHRRHGAELEAAILDAAWDDLLAVGIARVTMESVAARAQTGVAVLYRRWRNKDELIVAAIRYYGRQHPLIPSDTGSLRGDMLALLESFNQSRGNLVPMFAASIPGLLYGDRAITPRELRADVLGRHRHRADEVLYQRAAARGEIDPERIPASVRALPFDLMRHDLLFTLQPVSRERIHAIVDEIFWPLVAAYNAG